MPHLVSKILFIEVLRGHSAPYSATFKSRSKGVVVFQTNASFLTILSGILTRSYKKKMMYGGNKKQAHWWCVEAHDYCYFWGLRMCYFCMSRGNLNIIEAINWHRIQLGLVMDFNWNSSAWFFQQMHISNVLLQHFISSLIENKKCVLMNYTPD